MPYGGETWPFKEEDVVILERNDTVMVRWMCIVRCQDKISAEELRTRLKLNSIRENLQGRKRKWLGHQERMEESGWSSKCRIFEVIGNFPRELSRKHGMT